MEAKKSSNLSYTEKATSQRSQNKEQNDLQLNQLRLMVEKFEHCQFKPTNQDLINEPTVLNVLNKVFLHGPIPLDLNNLLQKIIKCIKF